MKPALLAPLAALTLFAGSAAADPGPAKDLHAWLQAHPDDAAWLAEAQGSPRAWIDHTDQSIVVVMKLPEGTTAETVVRTVMNYDVHTRTEDVELAFQAGGAFFTGTRVMSFFSPTVTKNGVQRAGGGMKLDWVLMDEADASTWLDGHQQELAAALRGAGMDHDADAVEAYSDSIKKRLDVVAAVIGSHQVYDGYYRYHQDLTMRSKVVDAAARKLGRARQYRAALKAACYSTGLFDWAGPRGAAGVEFEARGNVPERIKPGK